MFPEQQSMNINQVNIRAPEFMESAVASWFEILDAQFHLRNITTQTTKFYHIVASLPANVVQRLPPAVLRSQNYDELRQSVISSYERSKPEMLDKLMQTRSMTGRPSVYMHEMLSIAERIGISDDIVRHKFIQALPPSLAPVIATQKDLTPTQLGSLADELMPLLNKDMPAFQVNYAQAPSSQRRGNANTYRKTNGYKRNRPLICNPHIYWADQARSCRKWCKWPKKHDNLQILPNSRPSSPVQSDSEN